MKKRFQAYFKSENDAESAKAALQRLRVTDLIVDDIPEGDHKINFIPFTQPGMNWGLAGTIDTEGAEELEVKEETGRVTHLLEGMVQAQEYEQALRILSEKEGYIKDE